MIFILVSYSTSYQGAIRTGYPALASKLAIPAVKKGPARVPIEWFLIFDERVPATVYLRCEDPRVICLERLFRPQIWHVGGEEEIAVTYVAQTLKCRHVTYLSDELRQLRESRADSADDIIPF